jgi:hypothetical protein
MSDRLFKVKAYAQDAMSQSKRSKYQDMVESQMVAKPVLEIIQQETGANPFMTDPENLPETDEELSLYMQLNYKPAIEIAEEEAINTIFEENHYDDSRKRLNYDIATIGIAIAKHEFLQGTGVQVSYVDPANVVYSYTEDPFFKDCFYWGEIKTMPITELMKIDQSLTKEDLQQITQYSQAWYDYYNVAQFYENSMFFRDTCTLLYFNYKSTKKIVYKKKNLEGGGSRVVIARTVPDGVFIDADGLNEIDLGTGNAYNPEDALRLYFQTGSVIGRSYTQDGEFNNARVPIQQLTSNSGASKTQMLITNMNHYIDMIRSVTGLNEARDGSNPDPNSLVGLQKLAALNSNTATRHILDSSLYMYRSLSEALTYRVADILKYSDFKDEFANQIGKYNVSILEEIKDLYIYDFGIFIEISPDEEEKAQLEANIQMALSKGDINLEDAIDIREIRNLKLANQLLKMKRIKTQEREERMAMQKQAMQAQQQMQVSSRWPLKLLCKRFS